MDDEPLAIEILETYIEKLDNVEIVKKCNNALEAFSELHKHPIDVMFLDIQMPILNGVDFLKSLKNPPKVVFTTAYRDYAIESYELDVFDYLLKPISFERFLKVIAKLSTALSLNEVAHEVPNPIPKVQPQESSVEDSLYLNIDRKMQKIIIADILYIESMKDYVKIRLKDKKELISHIQISSLEEKLAKSHFLRIHKSYLVNKAKINFYTSTDIGIEGFEIPIGRNYKEGVIKCLDVKLT